VPLPYAGHIKDADDSREYGGNDLLTMSGATLRHERPPVEGVIVEMEHARLLEQGWRLGLDGCYRKSEPEQGEAEAGYSELMTLPAFLVRRTLPVRHFPGWRLASRTRALVPLLTRMLADRVHSVAA
jgi:hypothetical protein